MRNSIRVFAFGLVSLACAAWPLQSRGDDVVILPTLPVVGTRLPPFSSDCIGFISCNGNDDDFFLGLSSPVVFSGPILSESSDPTKDGIDHHDNMDCDKGMGSGVTSHPVIIASGHKAKTEVDFQTSHLYPLALVRNYNNIYPDRPYGLFGNHWASNFDMYLTFVTDPQTGAVTKITAFRADGSQMTYTYNSTIGDYESGAPDADDWIEPLINGWRLQAKSGRTETYTADGRLYKSLDQTGIGWTLAYSKLTLVSATHTNGQSISFTWTNGRVSSVTDPAGKEVAPQIRTAG